MIPQSAAERHRKVKVFTAAGRFPAENDCRPAFSARPDKFLLFSAGISCKMEAVTKKKGGGDMASCLVQMGDGSVTLPGAAVRALLQKGDGDAALLYLALLRHSGAVPPRSLAGELRWERERIEQAERALREMKLIAPTAEELPAPAEEKPDYTAEEITDQLEHSAGFRELTAQVERRLGKKLSTPDVSALLGLYDYMGLPADVIYLLVCHCAERIARRFGEGRRPSMRQIEREGYAWARRGIDTQAAAAEYLKRYAVRQQAFPQYMRVLQLGDRLPAPTEERYLDVWQEMGFSPDAVALAYDKTMLRCHELKFPYLNGILKKWHEAGLHTVQEIEAGDRPAKAPSRSAVPAPGEKKDLSWMKQYIRPQDRPKEG
jgi:DnaD and phage-associated domain